MAFTHYQRITRHPSGRITREGDWEPLRRQASADGLGFWRVTVTEVEDGVPLNHGFAEAIGRVEYRGNDGLVTDLGLVFLRTIARPGSALQRLEGTGGAVMALRAVGCMDWRHHQAGPSPCQQHTAVVVAAAFCIDAPEDIPAGSTRDCGSVTRAYGGRSTITQR